MTPKETFLQVLKPAVLRQLAGDQFDLDLNTLSAADPDLLGVKAFAAFFPGGRVRLNQAAKETDTESRLSIAGAATSQPLAGLKVRITFLPNLTMACEFDGGTDSAVLERAFPKITGAGVLACVRQDALGFLKRDQAASLRFQVIVLPGSEGAPSTTLRISTGIRFKDTSIQLILVMPDAGGDVVFTATLGRVAEGGGGDHPLQDIGEILSPDPSPGMFGQALTAAATLIGDIATQSPVKLTGLTGSVSQAGSIQYVCATLGTGLAPRELLRRDDGSALLRLGKLDLHLAAVFRGGGAGFYGAISGEIAIGSPERPGTLAVRSAFFPSGSGMAGGGISSVPDGSVVVSLVKGSKIEIADLFQLLVPIPDVQWRDHLPQSTLSDFLVSISASGAFSAMAMLEMDWTLVGGLKLTSVSAGVFRDEPTEGDPKPVIQKRIAATMRVGATEIDLIADYSGVNRDAGWAFSGEVGTSIPLNDVVQDIASKLGIQGVGRIPDAFNATLTSLTAYFHSATMDLVLSAATRSETQIVVVVSGRDKKYAILIESKVHLGLASLPLVGDRISEASGQLTGIEDVGIESLRAILSGGLRTEPQQHLEDVVQLNAIIEAAQARSVDGVIPRLPEVSGSGTRISGKLAGDTRIELGITYFFTEKPQPPVEFPYDGAPDGIQDGPGDVGAARGEGAALARTRATWLDVQRSFGPVNVKRLGIACVQGEIRFLLDASLALSGLTVDLQGLSLAFPVGVISNFSRETFLETLGGKTDSRWSTNLDGLSLTYRNGPIAVSGGLLRVDPPPAATRYAYNGELLIKADTWAISAIGSFAQMESGEASLFAYGVLSAALGGPAFFFVTGIAAGFGYNRNLTLPTLEELPHFPLIAALTDTGVPTTREEKIAGLIQGINRYVYPASGQNWMAAGVRFTSFKVIDSFALLILSFGNRFEIGLLGISTVMVPARRPKGVTARPPIAFAQLVLEAKYAPEDGVLKIAAQLTPDSFVLSEKCRLTGGFALYTWFKDERANGELVAKGYRAGDFVLSIGGYHPDFVPPARYPSVPRVGANWRVDDRLTIKGSLYFALTPLAIMAGGALDANYQSGNLRAWFQVRVDFLLYWEPLYYQVEVRLNLGASYTMDWWFTTKTITAQVGVLLKLQGPPFGGRAVVDLYVCSFTIDFGEGPKPPEALDWPAFEAGFLPKASEVCLSRAAGGLLREIPAAGVGQSAEWVVNPETLVIVTSSAIPNSAAPIFNGTEVVHLGGDLAGAPFGVKPCQVRNGRLRSQTTLMWTAETGETHRDWDVGATRERLSRAAWFAGDLSPAGPTLQDLGGEQVTGELITGFRLTPRRKAEPPLTVPIKVADLPMTERTESMPPGAWTHPDFSKPVDYAAENHTAEARYRRLGAVDSADVQNRRGDLLAALRRQAIDLPAKAPMRYLAKAASHGELLVAPTLCDLGKMPSP